MIREISSCLRKRGCRCVLDESVMSEFMPLRLKCSNRFSGLQSSLEGTDGLEEDSEECSEVSTNSVVDITEVRSQVRVAERKVRVATWNFSGICSQHKQKEVAGAMLFFFRAPATSFSTEWEGPGYEARYLCRAGF